MSPRRKRLLAILLIVPALIGLEVGVRLLRRPRVAIVLVNETGSTARNVRAVYGLVKSPLGDVSPGGSSLVRLENGPEEDVTLSFEQTANPVPGIVVGGPELEQARRDGLRMVLTLKPNEVIRYLEEDPDADVSFLMRLFRQIRDAVMPEEPTPGVSPPSRLPRILRQLLGQTLPDDARRGILASGASA
ncbi:hypothetical protein [Paludisphaera rhizosphaerae]|uniref:hypothetical protein n=1 Tax=Paludisphaera rhizosphaerae TaxID=2711216 RepID=UPI0013EA4CD6|nr:hypothetical protein [Paludisphaera rhizosphaerae]